MAAWSSLLPQYFTLWSNKWSRRCCTVAVAVVVYVVSAKIFINSCDDKEKYHASRYTDRAGVVVLHQFKRGKYCPNYDQDSLKLESFLRLCEVPYVINTSMTRGPDGKYPWVNLRNGTPMTDTHSIIETIKTRQRNAGARLPPGDSLLNDDNIASLARIQRMIEKYFNRYVDIWRMYLDDCRTLHESQNFDPNTCRVIRFINRQFFKLHCLWNQTPIPSDEHIYTTVKLQCHLLEQYLKNRPFFCGSEPGTVDCAVFGGLAQLRWNAPGTHYEALVREDYPKLGEYCIRMKHRIFPDWNTLLNQ